MRIFLFLLLFTLLNSIFGSNIFPEENYIADNIQIDSKYLFFFWLFKARNNNPNAALLLWLQGGPGTSGVETALYENGPFRISNEIKAQRVAHSINNFTDVLYVDQPICTGFSNCDTKTRIPNDEIGVANDLYQFLINFLMKYPQYKGRDLYIAGQSFGGHFIPGAIPIIHQKRNNDINIKGIIIGNGHINPNVQFPQYAEYALAKKLISQSDYENVKKTLELCKRFLDLGPSYMMQIEAYCTGSYISIVGNTPNMKFNPYDVRKQCIKQPACYDFANLAKFMELPEVRKELNVEGKNWVITNIDVIYALRADYWKDYSAGLTYFLENNIPVLLYYGKEDFVCNYFGGYKTIESLKWNKLQDFLKSPFKNWNVDGKDMGQYKKYDKLTYIEINECGHMTMMDNPRAGLEIVEWIKKE